MAGYDTYLSHIDVCVVCGTQRRHMMSHVVVYDDLPCITVMDGLRLILFNLL